MRKRPRTHVCAAVSAPIRRVLTARAGLHKGVHAVAHWTLECISQATLLVSSVLFAWWRRHRLARALHSAPTDLAAAASEADSPRRIDLYVQAIASASSEPAAAGAEEETDADSAPPLSRRSVPREPPSCPNIHLPPASRPPQSVPQTGARSESVGDT